MEVNPNASRPMVQGSVSKPDLGFLLNSIGSQVNLYRYTSGHADGLKKAAAMLEGQAPGAAVVVTDTFSKTGRSTNYINTSVGRLQDVQSAATEQKETFVRTGDVPVKTIVYVPPKGDTFCPAAPSAQEGVRFISVDDAKRGRF
jgi:hypothetical protein